MTVWPLYLLILLLPFEHPEPVVRALGLEFTVLELVAGFTLVWMAGGLLLRGSARGLARAPLVLPALGFLAACLLSTAFAPEPRWLPFKFSLRVAAGVMLFVLAALVLRREVEMRRALAALGIASIAVALLAMGEALGVPGIERLVASFRFQDFEVGGTHRVAATFAYPNLAGGFLVLGLPSVLFRSRPSRWLTVLAGLLIFAAILLTYSRGALAGALVVPLVLAAWGRRHALPAVVRQAKWAVGGFLALGLMVTLGSPSFRLRAMSEGDASWYRADFLPEVAEVALEPGELAQVPLGVRNVGGRRWVVAGPKRFHISYHWFDLTAQRVLELEGERTALPGEVEPGETVRVLANVRAPRETGRYLLVWDMVQEHTTWFVGKAGAGHFMTVVVGNPQGAATPLESIAAREVAQSFLQDTWFPGRVELWSIAVRLFRENPVLGVGPDNFRWLYGPAAGRRRWDTRVFSNSLYLETLATTGLVGALAFFSLVGLAVSGLVPLAGERRVSRGREVEGSSLLAALLLASLSGFLVHGIFDYLLEPTSIYLAFWLVLGATSALMAAAREKPRALERIPSHACWV